MKINMPITNNEVILKKGTILVSRTDLKGRITYANDAFVEISGFTRDELIGASHNIVRHPDMPAAAFKDVWDTLLQNRPWQGLVKNRCKNGDFYWVEANAMPVFKNGVVYEYVSVRHVPDRSLIPATEALYRKVNEGEAALRPKGLAALAKYINEISIRKNGAFSVSTFLAPIFFFMYQLYLAQNYLGLGAVALSAFLATLMTLNLTRTIDAALNAAVIVCYKLSSGRYGNKMDLNRNDMMGDFFAWTILHRSKAGARFGGL